MRPMNVTMCLNPIVIHSRDPINGLIMKIRLTPEVDEAPELVNMLSIDKSRLQGS